MTTAMAERITEAQFTRIFGSAALTFAPSEEDKAKQQALNKVNAEIYFFREARGLTAEDCVRIMQLMDAYEILPGKSHSAAMLETYMHNVREVIWKLQTMNFLQLTAGQKLQPAGTHESQQIFDF